MKRLVDLSHVVRQGLVTYPGLPGPVIGEHLSREAELLVRAGAALVGIDSLNRDDDQDGTGPAHTSLLAAGIPICEHMTGLAGLPRTGFRFHAAPVKIEGLGSFPVRAYAVLA